MWNDNNTDSLLLLDVLRAALNRSGGQLWTVQPTAPWCHVTSPVRALRMQGWKLHVSATPLSAPIVLARAVDVLVRHGCSFKFATNLARVAELVSVWHDRGGSGKFITAYPCDDEQFRVLACELDEATDDLPGPRILSDRQLRPSSLVHFRYGAFEGKSVFTDDGEFRSRLRGPNGMVQDDRKAWFSPPAWAAPPFPDQPLPPAEVPESILLADRFRVRRAIRHANKGGVYRATDELRATEVIVKQARAHVGSALDGTDARDRLRQEARMLEALAPLAIAPAMIALFEEQGDAFLAEEFLSGVSLAVWSNERGDGSRAIAVRLVTMMEWVHDAGFVIRDFKPQNLMVVPGDEVKLIDAEYVIESGRTCRPAGTPGFVAPEVLAATGRVEASPLWDFYSLGITLFCAFTGLPAARFSRCASRLSWIAETYPSLAPFIPLIVGLTHDDPDQRWPLPKAREFLGADQAAPTHTPLGNTREIDPATLDRLVADGLAHLQHNMTPQMATLWPPLAEARDKDACSAWYGAAGVLAILTRANLRDAVAQAAAWIDERLFAAPRLLPGLCFGRGGTAWALHDAGALLGDDALASRALELARKLPVQSASPDITHGLSGAGMTHLHLWRTSGDATMLERATVYADSVFKAAVQDQGAWLWPTSKETDSRLAGINVYGFAHGVAGVGMFLLAAGQAVGEKRWLDAARGAGETLVKAALLEGSTARWPVSVDGEHDEIPITALGHWCGGPAGIGTFLIHLWAATGEQRYADLAELAAATSAVDMWEASVSACCGLAGDGHFLLDLAELTGERRFHARALEIAHVMATHLQGQTDMGFHYGHGLAGCLDFLLRLRQGGPTPWLPHHTQQRGGTRD